MTKPMHDYPCLDHPVARRLLEALAEGPATTTELVERLGRRRHDTEQHLSTLRFAGLIWRLSDSQSSSRGIVYSHEITDEGRRVLRRVLDATEGGIH